MCAKISDLILQREPSAYIDTSIGKLAVYLIAAGPYWEIQNSLGETIEDRHSLDVVRQLVPHVCYPAELLHDDVAKPKEPMLSQDDVLKLSDPDLNGIAKTILESHDYLYRKRVHSEKTETDGRVVHSFDYGDVEHPRREGEASSEYLHRIILLDRDRRRKQMKSFMQSVVGPARFSASLSQNIAKTLSRGEELANRSTIALSSIQQEPAASILSRSVGVSGLGHLPQIAEIDYEAIDRNRLAPFESLGQRLDRLIELNHEQNRFSAESNETQIRIASEIKASGEESATIAKKSLHAARWGIGFTIAVLILTVLGLAISELDRRRSSADTSFFRERAEAFANGFGALSEQLRAERDVLVEERVNADAKMMALIEQMAASRVAQDEQLLSILRSQSALLKQQAQDRIRDRETVEQMQRRLLQIEAELKRHRNDSGSTN